MVLRAFDVWMYFFTFRKIAQSKEYLTQVITVLKDLFVILVVFGVSFRPFLCLESFFVNNPLTIYFKLKSCIHFYRQR